MKKESLKYYIAIDLKSFYASVECVERGLDPFKTNLVVADNTRTNKTICLAVSPALKSYGVGGRPRMFELEQTVKKVNSERLFKCKSFSKKSCYIEEIKKDNSIEIDYIVAIPRMAKYIEYSKKIYSIYLKYISEEDIHPYSIDEVFIDATPYLVTYNMNPRELAMTLIKDVLIETGITATVGIGTNLYLAKVAMDILAKKMPADKNGVRIAELNEKKYRELMWDYRPITDFWRIGKAYSKKLQSYGIYTMGDVAKCSISSPSSFHNEDLLYKLFGKNAELLIDHAWGYEPCTISDIKKYIPSSRSINSSQILHHPYTSNMARLIAWEMADLMILELVDKNLKTNQIVLTLSYDVENLKNPFIVEKYNGEITIDAYGRKKPKHSRGTINLEEHSSSTKKILEAVLELYDRIVNTDLLLRKISISMNKLISANLSEKKKKKQFTIFTDYDEYEKEEYFLRKEHSLQKTVIGIKKKYGKNSLLKASNLQEEATTILRNTQIGGHKAWITNTRIC